MSGVQLSGVGFIHFVNLVWFNYLVEFLIIFLFIVMNDILFQKLVARLLMQALELIQRINQKVIRSIIMIVAQFAKVCHRSFHNFSILNNLVAIFLLQPLNIPVQEFLFLIVLVKLFAKSESSHELLKHVVVVFKRLEIVSCGPLFPSFRTQENFLGNHVPLWGVFEIILVLEVLVGRRECDQGVAERGSIKFISLLKMRF